MTVVQLAKKFLPSYRPQNPSSGPYPQSILSSPRPYAVLIEDQFRCIICTISAPPKRSLPLGFLGENL